MSNEIHDKRDLEKLYELMQLYEKRFTHFAFSYISDSEASKDYVLEAFTDYWNHRHSLGENPNIPAFILTVVKHKCLNHLRNKKKRELISKEMQDLQTWEMNLQINSLDCCDPRELFASEIFQIVDKTLGKLPVETRKIFHLSRFENKTRKEIAEHMNMTTKGVEYHIGKALAALRRKLKDYRYFTF